MMKLTEFYEKYKYVIRTKYFSLYEWVFRHENELTRAHVVARKNRIFYVLDEEKLIQHYLKDREKSLVERVEKRVEKACSRR